MLAAALWLAALVTASPAQAAAYRGKIDPRYGAPFETPGFAFNLGWRGEVEFFLPSQCDPPGPPLPGDRNNAADCNGDAVVQSAFIQFYDHDAAGQPTLETLIFDASSLDIEDIRYDAAGAPTGLRTSTSNLVASTLTNTLFALVFVLDSYTFDNGVADVTLNTSGPLLLRTDCTTDDTGPGEDCDYLGANDFATHPPTVVITRIPEPASLLLAMLGLLAVASGRRRWPGSV